MRQAISRRLKDAQNTTAMLTTFQEVDMTEIMNLRKEYKDMFEQTHGAKLGFMSAFLKASAFALKQIPAINAVIDDASNEVVYRDYIDVSVAVASPRGLVVPVVRDVQNMSIFKIEAGIAELARKAKNEELTMDDMTGGTFTISNGGIFGSMMGTPIINPPQSAILGMHATKLRPVVLKSGEIAARPIMYLALTYDHRLVDGREAVTFLCAVRDQIEDPRRLLLEC
jgi:2-oxoglutarate dehydrogenase E2 component (dihydrolipoamide succinyltransferase)